MMQEALSVPRYFIVEVNKKILDESLLYLFSVNYLFIQTFIFCSIYVD